MNSRVRFRESIERTEIMLIALVDGGRAYGQVGVPLASRQLIATPCEGVRPTLRCAT